MVSGKCLNDLRRVVRTVGTNRQWIRWVDDGVSGRERTTNERLTFNGVTLSQMDRRSFVVLNAAGGLNGGVDIHRLMPEKLPD